MSTNLFEVEMANLENDSLHKVTENNQNKRQSNHRKLASRRAVEDHLERQKLREEFDSWDLEFV